MPEDIRIAHLKPLLLAGGESSRMGTPKHLLKLNGVYLYLHLVQHIIAACPECDTIYLSLKRASSVDLDLYRDGYAITIIYDEHYDTGSIGPAAGLLAAHSS